MIEILKYSSLSFLLKIDTQGIEEMLKYIEMVSNKSEKYIQILYLGQKKRFAIYIDCGRDDILIREEIIEIYLDEEELEYLKERLNNSLINKCFYPAEICERRYKNKYVTIYCAVI